MCMLLTNALLVDLDSGNADSPFDPIVEAGCLRLAGGKIVDRGALEPLAGEEVVDCGGAVVLPGLVNGHTHVYSALAAGMPMPPRNPRNFHDILSLVWWRLDRAHDEASIRSSGVVGALDAIRCGTTTLIDHHASPNWIDGSLDALEDGLGCIGVRGVLCYEITDRNGPEGAAAGIAESERYLGKCRDERDGHFAALIGGHASFTLSGESLEAMAALSRQYDAGIHLHLAEDPCDEVLTLHQDGRPLLERLDSHGLLQPGSLFAHGTHLAPGDIALFNERGLSLAHNTRSNMNNAVGYAPLGRLRCATQLGTDGIGANLFEEARTAWFKAQDAGAGLTPADVLAMLARSARFASRCLGVTVGRLEKGAAADVVVTNYTPATPLDAGNLAGHFLFALGAQHVRGVIVGGEWRLRDGAFTAVDEKGLRARARDDARALWGRME